MENSRENLTENQSLDLESIRRKLENASGRQYWRGLEEVAETEEFRRFVEDEFPNRSTLSQIDRRDFLKYMGAGLVLAGLTSTGCRSLFLPQQKLVPYVTEPEGRIDGIPTYYSTALNTNGYGLGVIVKTVEGRPMKIEGNELHPASLGAADAISQSALLTFYDPDRSDAVLNRGEISTWPIAVRELLARLDEQANAAPGTIAVLSRSVVSPTVNRLLGEFLNAFPSARHYQWQPVNEDAAYEGSMQAFGEPVNTIYRFDNADVVLAIDSDFMLNNPGCLRYARDFMARRRVSGKDVQSNRLYSVDCTPTLTGAMADNRAPLRPDYIEAWVRNLAIRLGVPGVSGQQVRSLAWDDALVQDLKSHQGRCIVIAGAGQSAEVHAMVHAINAALGNVGRTVFYTDSVPFRQTNQVQSLLELVNGMRSGRVRTLLILDSNPVFDAPADFLFEESLKNVPFKAHLGLYRDETARQCDFHMPMAHDLESWGDVRAFDGTVSIQQPMISPLYGGRTIAELLADLVRRPLPPMELVQQTWFSEMNEENEQQWREWLRYGIVPDSAFPAKSVTLQALSISARPEQSGMQLILRPDPTIWDGSYANNGWLQELPKPITKVTWDNTAQMGVSTAQKLGVTSGEWVEVQRGDVSMRLPAYIVPGLPEDTLVVHFGYGRTSAGIVGNGVGFDVYPLRTATALWQAGGVEVRKAGGRYNIASTQTHASMEGRDLVRYGTIKDYKLEQSLDPHYLHLKREGHYEEYKKQGKDLSHRPISMFPQNVWDKPYEGYQWGMTIDLNHCIGCGACVAACNSENNIPVVGKSQVGNGRWMHWIRIDRYYATDKEHGATIDNPDILFMPLNCMMCELAPCEPVCPVAATVHSHEGLNQMVYNRCIGTRYCSNNCPYKVRRFNFLDYSGGNLNFQQSDGKQLLRMINNPEVTVRGRGVMEKCTYCVQRINAARIAAKIENRTIRDGEIKTACEQTCPTQAIVFGDVADPTSRVSQLKREKRNYMLLSELNTRPRTTYLGRITNPNPEVNA